MKLQGSTFSSMLSTSKVESSFEYISSVTLIASCTITLIFWFLITISIVRGSREMTNPNTIINSSLTLNVIVLALLVGFVTIWNIDCSNFLGGLLLGLEMGILLTMDFMVLNLYWNLFIQKSINYIHMIVQVAFVWIAVTSFVLTSLYTVPVDFYHSSPSGLLCTVNWAANTQETLFFFSVIVVLVLFSIVLISCLYASIFSMYFSISAKSEMSSLEKKLLYRIIFIILLLYLFLGPYLALIFYEFHSSKLVHPYYDCISILFLSAFNLSSGSIILFQDPVIRLEFRRLIDFSILLSSSSATSQEKADLEISIQDDDCEIELETTTSEPYAVSPTFVLSPTIQYEVSMQDLGNHTTLYIQ